LDCQKCFNAEDAARQVNLGSPGAIFLAWRWQRGHMMEHQWFLLTAHGAFFFEISSGRAIKPRVESGVTGDYGPVLRDASVWLVSGSALPIIRCRAQLD
jgi:hypothetical protein